MADKRLRFFLPLAIIMAGVAGMYLFKSLKHEAGRHKIEDKGALVDVVPARSQDHRVVVRATGVAKARRQVEIMPQVSGKVVWISPRLVEGGRFRKGEKLLQIEKKDYLIALKSAEAQLSKAIQELEVAKKRSEVERRQWYRLHPDGTPPPTPLVFFEPQLKAAEAAAAAAEAAKDKALLDLERTEVKAPFDCRIIAKKVDLGSFVKAGAVVAEVLGEEVAEVVIPVPSGEIKWLRLPARARVSLLAGDGGRSWEGRAVRFLPAVDPLGRLPRLVVEVPHPFGAGNDEREIFFIAQNSFVEAVIEGELLKGVFVLPSKALRKDDTVWVAGADGLLHVKRVELLRREKGEVVVKGLEEGDLVITTLIQGAAPGMKVRKADKAGQ